jgi:hypothetical protein
MKCTRGFYKRILGLTATMDHEMKGGHWFGYGNWAGTITISFAEGMLPSKDGCIHSCLLCKKHEQRIARNE